MPLATKTCGQRRDPVRASGCPLTRVKARPLKLFVNRVVTLGTTYRIPLTLVIGAVICFLGLGREGLWEPWEMDRAALARSIVEPPRVPIALGPSQAALQAPIIEAADNVGVVLRFATPPKAGARGIASGARTLQDAVSSAKNDVVGGIILDVGLLASAPMDPTAWTSAGTRLLDATRFARNGHVILVGAGPGLEAAKLKENALLALAGAKADADARDIGLTTQMRKDPGLRDRMKVEIVSNGSMPQNVRVVVASDAGAFATALDDSVAVGANRVRFKFNGETKMVAPFESWLTAISYNILGTTEFATRLPGALLAFAALFLLVFVTRRVWSDRTAVIAGMACMTTPLFYAQARSATGETGALLALTMVACGLLLHAHLTGEPEARTKRDQRNIWLLFGGGLLIGFLSKGLFALLTYALLTGGTFLVTGDKDKRSLMLAGVSVGALALASLWVLSSSPDGFAGMFGFSEALFSTGPPVTALNFDLVIHQIGFGTFPWGPLLVMVFGGLIYYGVKNEDRRIMVAVLWFAIPVVLMMLMLKNYNQLLWPAAPAGALAIGLALDHLIRKRVKSHVASLLLFVMFLILIKELGSSPQPLASFLTYDPPFAKQGASRFPEVLALGSMVKYAAFGMLLVSWVYFSKLVSFAKKAMAFLRKPFPFWAFLMEGILSFVVIGLLLRILTQYSSAMGTPEAAGLAPEQRTFASSFLGSGDPVTLAFYLVSFSVFVVGVIRWVPAWVRRFRGAPADVAYQPTFLKALSAQPGRRLQRFGLLATAGAWLLLAVAMFGSVETPPDYYGPLFSGGSLLLLIAAAGGAFLWVRYGLGEETKVAGTFAAGVVGLFFAANFMRDAWHFPSYGLLLSAIGAFALVAAVLPSAWHSGTTYYRGATVIKAALAAAVALPLISRYDEMLPILKPTAAEPQLEYIFTKSRITFLTLFSVVFLVVNRYVLTWLLKVLMPGVDRVLGAFGFCLDGGDEHRDANNRRGPDTLSPKLRSLHWERGSVAVVVLVALSLVVAGGAIAAFYPALSYNVSQKHIVNTYREAEGVASNTLGDNIFKHGSFATAGRGDANFYTASIPEVRDRNRALQVLLGQRDMAVQVETAAGTQVVATQGWLHADAQMRVADGVVGIATAASDGSLTDAKAKWPNNAHVGKLLIDSRGGEFPITANDATVLTVTGTPYFNATRPEDILYAIDDPKASNHQATAKKPSRNWFLMPSESFSGVNHAFRKLSGGRHIPVIDGRSYRVLLTASWLGAGEENQNRYARHALTREQFDALDLPGMMKAKPGSFLTNFDDTIWIVGFSTATPIVSRGSEFEVTVYYQSIKEVRTSYKVFMHIDKRGSSNRIHSDHWPLNLTQGGEDDKSCTGCFRTDHWLPGDVIVDTFRKKVPAGNPSGIQDVWTGMYRPSGGTRMKVKGWDKALINHDGGNRVRLGNFTVR